VGSIQINIYNHVISHADDITYLQLTLLIDRPSACMWLGETICILEEME